MQKEATRPINSPRKRHQYKPSFSSQTERHLKSPGRQVSKYLSVSLYPHSEKDGSAVHVSCTSSQPASCAIDAVARTEPDGTV
jgi:hypothetical protein